MNTLDVVVLSSDLETRRQLKQVLERNDIDPICSSSLRDCRQALAERCVDLVFCDRSLADGSYRDLLRTAGLADRKVKVVVTSRLAGQEAFLKAIRLGAFDMIATPCVPTEVEWVLSQVIRARRAEQQAARLTAGAPEVQVHS